MSASAPTYQSTQLGHLRGGEAGGAGLEAGERVAGHAGRQVRAVLRVGVECPVLPALRVEGFAFAAGGDPDGPEVGEVQRGVGPGEVFLGEDPQVVVEHQVRLGGHRAVLCDEPAVGLVEHPGGGEVQAEAEGDLHPGGLQLRQPGLHLVLVGHVEHAAGGFVVGPVQFHHRDLDAAGGFLRGVVGVGAQGADRQRCGGRGGGGGHDQREQPEDDRHGGDQHGADPGPATAGGRCGATGGGGGGGIGGAGCGADHGGTSLVVIAARGPAVVTKSNSAVTVCHPVNAPTSAGATE